MRRLGIIAVALLLAVLPVLHSHSLHSDNSTPSCPACTSVSGGAVIAPVVSAPIVLAYTLIAPVETTFAVPVARTFSARAPPSA